MITQERLEAILTSFPRLTIALVGDLFLDRYLEIEPGVYELSIETGLEAYQVTRVRKLGFSKISATLQPASASP